jgi:Ni,Fe-hydrogenase maturation factor
MTLLIAIGNSLRHDDGVAHRVLELLGPLPGTITKSCLQLSPEMATELSLADTVVFIDADINPGLPSLELLTRETSCAFTLTHGMRPCDLVAIARRLYAFTGIAYLCRVPGVDFSEGQVLSERAESNARMAAELLRKLKL